MRRRSLLAAATTGLFAIVASVEAPSARAAIPPDQLPPPTAGTGEIHDAAKQILQRPEFQPPPKSLYQRALEAAGRLFGRAVDVVLRGGRGAVLAWLLVVVIAAAITFFIVRGVQLGRRPKAAVSDAGPAVRPRRPATDWDREAETLEARGEWRGALRCRYRALVARLAGAGVVEEVPGRTAGEYRMLLAGARPAAAGPFSEATDLFESSWYGGLPTGPDEADWFRRLASDTTDRVGATAGVGRAR